MIKFLILAVFILVLLGVIILSLKDLKNSSEKYKKRLIFLFLFGLLGFNLILILGTIFPDCYLTIKTQKFTTGYGFYEFPLNTHITCEKGVNIEEYGYINKKVIYTCLELDENGNCAGVGKKCIVRIINYWDCKTDGGCK